MLNPGDIVTVNFIGAQQTNRRPVVVPTASHSYFNREPSMGIRPIGKLSDRDLQGVQACLSRALAIS